MHILKESELSLGAVKSMLNSPEFRDNISDEEAEFRAKRASKTVTDESLKEDVEEIFTTAQEESFDNQELPVDFLTEFVSKSWSEIGNIKSDIESIANTFKGTEKVQEILQDLADAYLICIGQLEKYLNKEDYIEQSPEIAADLAETDVEKIETSEEYVDADSELETPVADEIKAPIDEDDFIFSEDDFKTADDEIESNSDEVVVDFDEPISDGEKISDEDLEELLKNI